MKCFERSVHHSDAERSIKFELPLKKKKKKVFFLKLTANKSKTTLQLDKVQHVLVGVLHISGPCGA